MNLKGPWLMTRAALRVMIPSGPPGAFVNTSSFLSTGATVGTSAYSASKAGLDAMIRAIALEAGPHGIRVNNTNPGVIDKPMLRAHGDAVIPPLAARAALGRIGTPGDIADVATWLCTDEARFITGQSTLVDGGFTIPGPHQETVRPSNSSHWRRFPPCPAIARGFFLCRAVELAWE